MFRKYRYKFELLILLLVVALLFMLTQSPRDPLVSLIHKLLIIADVLLILGTLRRLWREKWRKFVAKKAHEVILRVVEFFIRVSDRLNLASRRKNVISGKTKVEFNFERAEKQREQRARGKRWKHLVSARERLRYIYRMTLSDKIKHGGRIYAQDTPSELARSEDIGEGERELMLLYATYRYDERREPDDKAVADLKEKYFPDIK